MRVLGLAVITLTGLGLSGCSQISSVFSKKPHYHTNDGTVVYTPVQTQAHLRTTPQQSYQFSQATYVADTYVSSSEYAETAQSVSEYPATQYSSSQYAAPQYATPQYATPQYSSSQYTSPQYTGSQSSGSSMGSHNSQPTYSVAAFSDPRDAEFVMLNGESNIVDWQNCETLHRGYLFASEYEFGLNPEFEVCMRNKGYVLTSEYGANASQTLNAQKARLRGPVQYSQTSSSYQGYFR